MAAKFCNLVPFLLVATLTNVFTLSSGAHVQLINDLPLDTINPVQIQIQNGPGGPVVAQISLVPSDAYQVNPEDDIVLVAAARFGLHFRVQFCAHDPARDKGHDAIYWKADESGFSISYDTRNWKLLAPWVIE